MTVAIHEYTYVPGAEMAYCSCGWEHAGEDADDCDEKWELHCAAAFEAYAARADREDRAE